MTPNAHNPALWSQAHKAGIIEHDTFEDWVAEFRGRLTPDQVGYAFLYNVSLESFNWPKFESVWEANYGQGSKVEGVYVFVPVTVRSKDGHLRSRIGSWLDAEPLVKFAQESMKHQHQSGHVRAVCEKTHFTLVDLIKTELADLQGEYAFGIYFSQDATFSVIQDIGAIAADLHTDPFRQEQEFSAAATTAIERLTEHVELILGAGVREPFSSLVGRHYKYKLIIPISSRRESGLAQPRRRCVIREHLKILARLWDHKLDPMQCAECAGLETIQNRNERATGLMRMDRFMAWARSNVTRSGIVRVRPLSHDALPLLKVANTTRMFSADSEPEVLNWLYQRGNLSLSESRVFADSAVSRYYRRPQAKEVLRDRFVSPLEDLVLAMLEGEEFVENKFPVFLVVGESGSGKTQLAKDGAAFWKRIIETQPMRDAIVAQREKRTEKDLFPHGGKCSITIINCNTTPRLEDVLKAKEECIKGLAEVDVGFLLIDEIQSVQPFAEFILKIYGVADCYADKKGKLVVIYLTSDDQDKILEDIARIEDHFKPADFLRRLTNKLTVPPARIDDIVPVIADFFHNIGGDGVRISKQGIAYLILRSLLVPSIKDVLAYLNSFACKEAKPVYEVVDLIGEAERGMIVAFSRMYPQLWKALDEPNHKYLIATANG